MSDEPNTESLCRLLNLNHYKYFDDYPNRFFNSEAASEAEFIEQELAAAISIYRLTVQKQPGFEDSIHLEYEEDMANPDYRRILKAINELDTAATTTKELAEAGILRKGKDILLIIGQLIDYQKGRKAVNAFRDKYDVLKKRSHSNTDDIAEGVSEIC